METVVKVCKFCGKSFDFSKNRASISPEYGRFCSAKCRDSQNSVERKKSGITRICQKCGKTFTVNLSVVLKGKAKFCSKECSMAIREERTCKHCGNQFVARVKDSKEYCSKKCAYASNERKEIFSKSRQNENFRGNFLLGIFKRNQSEEWKNNALAKRGAGNHNYKDGISRKERHIDMGRKEYIDWRNEVFTRDNYTCQDCNKHGGNLHAHHLKEYAKYPELRYTVSNGLTLCVQCHKKRHSK